MLVWPPALAYGISGKETYLNVLVPNSIPRDSEFEGSNMLEAWRGEGQVLACRRGECL